MKKKYRFENVDVEFEQERWRVFIKIYRDGKIAKELVADAGIESGDRIWFGTYEEWREESGDGDEE